MKNLRWKGGLVVEVPLGEGWHSYAQMLERPEYAFFAQRYREPVEPARAVHHAILFRLWVMNRAHSRGRWPVVGAAPISPALSQQVPRFKQDAVHPSRLTIYISADQPEIPTTPEECVTLEPAAVWDPEHVEQRLRDHFAEQPNTYVESMRARLTP